MNYYYYYYYWLVQRVYGNSKIQSKDFTILDQQLTKREGLVKGHRRLAQNKVTKTRVTFMLFFILILHIVLLQN